MADTPEEQARIDAEILAALMEEGEGTIKHGSSPQLREVIHQGDSEYPAPVVAKVFEQAGVQAIYDVHTGERSLTSRNMLPAQLRKLGPDGKRMFTTKPPATPPARGQHKCLLHPDVRKPEYDQWGLPVCRKANLTSPLQVEQHMRHRHRVEWETIKAERERLEKEEERALQRQIAAAAVARSEAEQPKVAKKGA